MIVIKVQIPPDNLLLDEPFHEPIFERLLLLSLSQIQPTHMAEQIDKIIDDQIVSIRDGVYHRFLVYWKGLSDSDNTWINREELQRLDSDRLDHYESRKSSHSTELSFSQPRGNDVNISSGLQFYTRSRRRTLSVCFD